MVLRRKAERDEVGFGRWVAPDLLPLGRADVAALASPAFAQDTQWWEKFPGFQGRPRNRGPAANDDRRRPEALNDLRPDKVPLRSQEMVEALDDAIQRYQQIVSNGGWPAIPGTRPIRPEDNDERVGLLYRRLAASGEWRNRPSQSLFGIDYSEGLESAVRRFQENHGLRVTGRVDRSTLQALNIPAQARLAAAQDQSAAPQGADGAETGRSLCAGERRRASSSRPSSGIRSSCAIA